MALREDPYRFDDGDLVRLKSGGPTMVISSRNRHIDTELKISFAQYRCVWIAEDGRAQNEIFREHVLTLDG